MTGHRWLVSLVAAITAVGTVLAGGGAAQAANPNTAVLAWSPANPSYATGYDYGTLDAGAGATKSATFTLTNSGTRASGTLTPVTLVNTNSTAFSITSDGCSGLSLAPNGSCQVTVVYAPTASGESDSSTLTATAEHSIASLPLTGKSGTPDLTLTPATSFPTPAMGLGRGASAYPYPGTGIDPNGTKSYNYDFGSGSSATQTFTVTNSSTATGTSFPLQLACCNAGFTLPVSNDHTSGVQLAPGESSTFQLTFTAPAVCSTELFATPLVVSSTNDSPYIRVTSSASCGPAITSVTATLDNLTAAFQGNPQSVTSGSGTHAPIGVNGTLKNLNFRGNPPPLRGGGLHGFTIQIPFSISQGSLNCDASRSYDFYPAIGGSGTCSVNNNVLTVTQNFPPSYYWYWAPSRSQDVTYAAVGSTQSNGAYVTWGTPTVTAVH